MLSMILGLRFHFQKNLKKYNFLQIKIHCFEYVYLIEKIRKI
jgi:hypothetical protein